MRGGADDPVGADRIAGTIGAFDVDGERARLAIVADQPAQHDGIGRVTRDQSQISGRRIAPLVGGADADRQCTRLDLDRGRAFSDEHRTELQIFLELLNERRDRFVDTLQAVFLQL